MISKNQARLIISHSEPHVLDDAYPRPISERFVHVTDDTLRRLGIKESQLENHLFYDGPERVTKGGEAAFVHVFDLPELERYAGVKWSEYVSARRDAERVSGRGA